MTRYRLSPEAQNDLMEIRRCLLQAGGPELARHVLGEVREKLRFLAGQPGAGHRRTDLTDEPVKFWPVFSYLIVYDPAQRPIGVARVLHASRDLETEFSHQPPRAP